MKITYQKAKFEDLKIIINLLYEDELGKNRESLNDEDLTNYENAFREIDEDKNQFLVVGKFNDEIISTCHLTIMPSLTYSGSRRLNIESVRVKAKYRGQKLGQDLMNFAVSFAEQNNCKMIQLTTNKLREDAKRFYEKNGFLASHEGMKKVL